MVDTPATRRWHHVRNLARAEAASGIALLAATCVALVWANSPWSDWYTDLWETPLTIQLGQYRLSRSLVHWVNDGLMAVFFFVIGLEIKREMLVGELAEPRQALLPIAAAIGGAVVPAAIYMLLNAGTTNFRGWGVPMATDIAFVVGVLALLGSRVPASLKVFLTTLAVVDDLIAVLVIALFYSEGVRWFYLVSAVAVVGALVMANRLDVRLPFVYGALGIALWLLFAKSGVHATVAGILLAATIPVHRTIAPGELVERGHRLLEEFRQAGGEDDREIASEPRQSAISELETVAAHAQSPVQRLERRWYPRAAYFIMPVFALANAGVPLGSTVVDALSSRIGLGIIVGLLVGKQFGITATTALLVTSRIASLPSGVTLRHIYGTSWLAGIGFTMSIFIADLAFVGAERLTLAKIGILVASIIAGLVGWLVLSPPSRVLEPAHRCARGCNGSASPQSVGPEACERTDASDAGTAGRS